MILINDSSDFYIDSYIYLHKQFLTSDAKSGSIDSAEKHFIFLFFTRNLFLF